LVDEVEIQGGLFFGLPAWWGRKGNLSIITNKKKGGKRRGRRK